MKPGDPNKVWSGAEKFLEDYQTRFSPTKWKWLTSFFNGREGWYVFLRLAFLLVALITVFSVPSGWCRKVLTAVSVLLLLDILIYNTSVAIITRQPISSLRSIILTFLSYLSVGISFAVLYAGLRNDFGPKPLSSAWQALYFSLVTMTTLGYGDITPLSDRYTAQILVILELGVSLYFLVILVGRVIVWHAEPRN